MIFRGFLAAAVLTATGARGLAAQTGSALEEADTKPIVSRAHAQKTEAERLSTPAAGDEDDATDDQKGEDPNKAAGLAAKSGSDITLVRFKYGGPYVELQVTPEGITPRKWYALVAYTKVLLRGKESEALSLFEVFNDPPNKDKNFPRPPKFEDIILNARDTPLKVEVWGEKISSRVHSLPAPLNDLTKAGWLGFEKQTRVRFKKTTECLMPILWWGMDQARAETECANFKEVVSLFNKK